MRAMQTGTIARLEELTRVPSDVQDALITILSEKTLPVPELNTEVQAQRGFNLIATANDRDRGVNELSSALRRRFNTVVLPVPASADDEVEIVARRVAQLGRSLDLPEVPAALEEIRRVVTVFRELRSGLTEDGRTKLKSPTGTLSTAEAISVITNGMALAAHFGDGTLHPGDVAAGHRRRGRQGPGLRRRGLAGIPGDRGPRAHRLARLLPGRPRCLSGSTASATTARARPGRWCRSWTASRPTMLLVEGPPEADDLVRWVADSGLEPPVALLGYAADDPRRAAFWPFAVFSPEWQAIRWAVGQRACRSASSTCPTPTAWASRRAGPRPAAGTPGRPALPAAPRPPAERRPRPRSGSPPGRRAGRPAHQPPARRRTGTPGAPAAGRR